MGEKILSRSSLELRSIAEHIITVVVVVVVVVVAVVVVVVIWNQSVFAEYSYIEKG